MRTIKAYLVPIIGLFLIIILFYSFFSGGSESKNNNVESVSSKIGINISYESDTEASLVLSNGKEEKVEFGSVLSKGEKVKVKSGELTLSMENGNTLKLSKNGILEYKKNGILYLDSANLWIEAKNPTEVSLKYGNVKIGKDSIVNLNQNELESIVYNLSGITEIQNLSGNSTVLAEDKQLTISRQDASNTDLDLSTLKLDIEEYFKLGDWYTKNYSKNDFVSLEENTENKLGDDLETSTGATTASGSSSDSVNNYGKLTFYNLEDESYVTKSEIDISGNYFDEEIVKITVNSTDIKLDKENKTFELKGFKLNGKENDLVFKVFDENSNLLWKKVITLYATNGTSSNKVTDKKVENFPVKASDFSIYAPNSSGKFETNTDVSIKGKVTNPDVKAVLVNGYRLKSYNGSTWRYHAFVAQGTLKPGTNNYTVKYLDKSGNVIYKQYYTIIKKLPEEKKEDTKKEEDAKKKDTTVEK